MVGAILRVVRDFCSPNLTEGQSAFTLFTTGTTTFPFRCDRATSSPAPHAKRAGRSSYRCRNSSPIVRRFPRYAKPLPVRKDGLSLRSRSLHAGFGVTLRLTDVPVLLTREWHHPAHAPIRANRARSGRLLLCRSPAELRSSRPIIVSVSRFKRTCTRRFYSLRPSFASRMFRNSFLAIPTAC